MRRKREIKERIEKKRWRSLGAKISKMRKEREKKEDKTVRTKSRRRRESIKRSK